MKSRFTEILGTGLVAAGLMLAQTPQTTPAPTAAPGSRAGQHGMHRLTRQLNLTPDQKARAKQIFGDAKTTTHPLASQVKDARQALSAATKANAPEAEIDRLSNNVGALSTQLTAARAKTFAKFYAILTPDQKAKLETLKSNHIRPAAFKRRAPAAAGQMVQQ